MEINTSTDNRPFFLPAGAPVQPSEITEFYPGHAVNPVYPSVISRDDLWFGARELMKRALLADDPEDVRQSLALSDLYADRASLF